MFCSRGRSSALGAQSRTFAPGARLGRRYGGRAARWVRESTEGQYDRLMSSDPRDWDQMVTEAHEAERHSRRLGERITDRYAAKFWRLADPG
jgi:hypothetical protein